MMCFMATIVLGCDRNGANDSSCQNTVAKVLEKAGHTVEKLSIGPNYFASYSYGQGGKNPKGKIGVFLIAAGITAIADLYDGNTGFKYAYFGIRGDLGLPRMKTMEDFKTSTIAKDWHGDCISKSCNKLQGKTFPQMNEVIKSKCQVVFGSTPEEIGESVIKAMGGEVEGDSGKSKDSSGGSIKEALQNLLKHWDGEVECYIRGDEVHINKIRDPEKYYVGIVQERMNVFSDSIRLTDVNSNVPNILEVNWTEGVITIKDESSIKRFGEILTTVEAVRKEVVEVEKKVETETTTDTEADTGTADDTGAGTDAGTDDGAVTSTTTSTIKETPINNYAEALDFAKLEWNKLQRDNGRTLELQVMGSNVWQSGEWVKVYLPSYSIDGYMYITRVSQTMDNGDWTCSLTLVDYPPGWGKEQLNENTEESDEDTATEEDTATDG